MKQDDPGALATRSGPKKIQRAAEIASEYSPTRPDIQWIARRCRVSVPVARLVCELAFAGAGR